MEKEITPLVQTQVSLKTPARVPQSLSILERGPCRRGGPGQPASIYELETEPPLITATEQGVL